ncbi:MAG: competence/damage-inducible protein A [Bacillota bacterium]
MQAAIISVGDELLMGKTVNTNQATISRELKGLGIETAYAVSVRDKKDSIRRALEKSREDVLVLTGGLGPTRDDLTKEVVAEHYGLELVENKHALATIQGYFERTGRKMSDTNLKQAYFPKDAIVLDNAFGTAPGMILHVDRQWVILLPGPPHEMRPMFQDVKRHLSKLGTKPISRKGLRVISIGESEMEERLAPLYERHREVNIAPYAEVGELTYIFTSEDEGKVDDAIRDFEHQFSDLIIGTESKSLEEVLVHTLMHQKKVISVVESCTGGMVASRIVNVPDASKVFKESYVLYDNESKMRQLGVNGDIIERFGAVSDQCVYELAYQLQQKTGADITLSISGIAGPGGGTDEKPVGTVYFGVSQKGHTKTYHRVFSGQRQSVRSKAASYGMYLVLRNLIA